jgi:hypothetical protein
VFGNEVMMSIGERQERAVWRCEFENKGAAATAVSLSTLSIFTSQVCSLSRRHDCSTMR